MRSFAVAFLVLLVGHGGPAAAQRWVTSWAAPMQGPYPTGLAVAQPDLSASLPDGAVHDQTFRMILRPSVWGRRARLRFSNAFGTEPLSIDGAFLGLQASAGTLMPGSNRPLTFKGKKAVTIAPGSDAWSDAVTLPFVGEPSARELQGRKLAASFHVAGDMRSASWHAAALQTSYATQPGAGALGELEDEAAFPASTTSWFFVDALDVQTGPDISTVVCLGDSITDGYGSTLNGDDRWPDVLGRRLLAADMAMAVVDAGIGGNKVTQPAEYDRVKGAAGGASVAARLDRDVLSLSGVTHVIFMEGINDLGAPDGSVEAVREAMKDDVRRIRAKIKGVKVYGGTLTPMATARMAGQSVADIDAKRRALNDFIRNSGGTFDGVIDFERAVLDRSTGGLRPEFIPNGTTGGAGDGVHPNRAGYLAMGDAVDLRLLHAPPKPKPKPAPPPPAEDAAAGQ